MGLHGGAAVKGKGVMHLPWELLALGSWYGIVGKKVHSVSVTRVIIILTLNTSNSVETEVKNKQK